MTEPAPAGTAPRTFAIVVGAMVAAGVVGYLITILSARGLGASGYAEFSVFWGVLYVMVGTLLGVQQEFARAARPAPARGRGDRVVALSSLLVAATGAAAVGVLCLLFAGPMGVPADLVPPLIAGVAVYGGVVCYQGVVYGIAAWRTLVLLTLGDVLLRLVAIVVALALGADAVGVAWATVLPFPVLLVIVLVATRVRVGGVEIDVPGRRLLVNTLHAVGAAVAVAVLVNGLPVLISLGRGDASSEAVGTIIFALTLTRAPLVVSVLALQSFLIVQFRDRAGVRLSGVLLLMTAGGAVLALLAWWLGPGVVAFVAGGEYDVSGELLGLLVLASTVTSLLAVTGASALARSAHGRYVASWSSAAVGSLALMLLPFELETRVLVAVAGGPLLGMLVHVGGWVVNFRRVRARSAV